MTNFVIKMHNMYYSRGLMRRATFSPKLEESTFFNVPEDAKREIADINLEGFCKIIQVTYVEHDIGYVEHSPLVGTK